ncbi:endonuclease domain-containing protein [Brevundimonas sp.]|uniref:endonuclease domain-containing protein n=1 Tax=Brevundimonas sp. TaxID=1871086 RepID=UPI0037C12802
MEGLLRSAGSVSRARVQRRALTPPEARLWVCLRRHGLAGLKFRRQHPIGPYVLDFYCAEAKLAVEVDGEVHSHPDRIQHDRRRTEWLERQGLMVLRISAETVRIGLDGVLASIRATAESRVG